MPVLHATSTFNVQATLNKWLTDGLAAVTRPAWLNSYTLVINQPEALVTFPAFSVAHLPARAESAGQGKNPGLRAAGAMEITAWARRQPDAHAQLNTMVSMVESLAAASTRVTLLDYQIAPAAPTTTAYQIDISGVETGAVTPHANPDVLFRRVVVHYTWVIRPG